MSKMSELSMKIEHKYSMKVGDTVKCKGLHEATVLQDALVEDGIHTESYVENGFWFLRVTSVR